MFGDGVHGHAESQDVTGRNENDQEQLTRPEQLTAKAAQENFSGIRHTMNMGKAPFELPDHIARIGSHETQTYQKNDGTALKLTGHNGLIIQITYGARPS